MYEEKGATVTLFGGAISASKDEAHSTVIDMRRFQGGSLDVKVNTGTGTFSLALMTSEVNVANTVFKQMYQEKADRSGVEVRPAIVTIASTSTSFSISGVRANYLKLVPTLSGTANVTFTFTPSRT